MKQEEMLELNACNSENNLNYSFEVSALKEEEAANEDFLCKTCWSSVLLHAVVILYTLSSEIGSHLGLSFFLFNEQII